MGFFHSLPVLELREWNYPYSRTPKCHSRSPLQGLVPFGTDNEEGQLKRSSYSHPDLLPIHQPPNHFIRSHWSSAKHIEPHIPPGDYLVTAWWPNGDQLVTTWWPVGDPLVTSWWPLGDHLVTTLWPLGDHLVTNISVFSGSGPMASTPTFKLRLQILKPQKSGRGRWGSMGRSPLKTIFFSLSPLIYLRVITGNLDNDKRCVKE